MNARTKFIVGGALVLSSAGYLMASSIKSTGTYYLTPTELARKLEADPSFHDVGLKMGAKVVRGSIQREPGGRQVRFRITDSTQVIAVEYKGIIPDTFTDAEDIDVVVEGRMGRDGVFHATTLLAKCASRYENAPTRDSQGSPQGGYPAGAYPPGATHPDGIPRGTAPSPAAPAAGTRS